MNHTKIAIVGTGLMGKRHIEGITKTKNIETMAVVDSNPNARDVANHYDVPFYESLEQMLNKIKPDGVIIATPNELHIQHASLCIEKDIPVLIEKPLATGMHEASIMLALAEEKRIPVLTGYFRRFNETVRATKEKITSGRIGDIVSIHSHFWLYKNDDYYSNAWRRFKGAGPIHINLCHEIDLLLYFAGDIDQVQAYTSNTIRGFEVEDTAVIIAKFKNKALCTINISDTIPSPWSWELTAGDNPVYPQTDQFYCMIGGTKGSIEFPNNRLWYYPEERHWFKPLFSETYLRDLRDPLVAQLEHFANVILSRETPVATGFDGLKVMAVLEAIEQSAKNSEPVYVQSVKLSGT